MSRYSAADREDILATAFANIERRSESPIEAQPQPVPEDRQAALAEVLRQPIESRNMRDAREITEQHERWKQQAEGEARSLEAKIMALVDQRIASVRADLHSVVEATARAVDAMGDTIAELREAAKEPSAQADQRIEALFARLERTLDRLGPRREQDNDKVFDLPPLPVRAVN